MNATGFTLTNDFGKVVNKTKITRKYHFSFSTSPQCVTCRFFYLFV